MGSVEHTYLRLRGPLLRLLTRWTGSRHDAEDALQTTFLRYLRMDRPLPEAQQAPYLQRMARNVFLDSLDRPERRFPHLEASAAIDMLEAQAVPAGGSSDPAWIAEQRQRAAQLESAIAELPERQRQALVLHRIDGLTQDQVAERMGISRRMVCKHLSAALHHCQQRARAAVHAPDEDGGRP